MEKELLELVLYNMGSYVTVSCDDEVVFTNVPVGFVNNKLNDIVYMKTKKDFDFNQKKYTVTSYTDVTELKNRINSDFKTGALSPEGFNEKVVEVITSKEPFVIGIYDIDKFKSINDTYGHLVGDMVLSSSTSIFKHNLRTSDFIGRFGGDEFLFVMPRIEIERAQQRLNFIMDKFNNGIVCNGKKVDVSISAGLIQYNYNLSYVENMEVVDQLLYTSKENGRNQVSTEKIKKLEYK